MSESHKREHRRRPSNFLNNKKQHKHTKDVSMMSFLHSLRKDMTLEAPKLAFDYMSMHNKLLHFLIDIKNTVIQGSKGDLVAIGLDRLPPWKIFPCADLISLNDFEAPFFVGSMLWGMWALGSPGLRKEKWSSIMKLLAEHNSPWHFCVASFCNKVPEMIEQQIRREGDVLVKKAKVRSATK